MQGKYEATAQTGVCGGKATAGPSVRAADAEGGECGLGRSPQSWWHATLHSGKKHQASEGVCGAKPHDFF